jgi:hypothetical protein
MTVALINQPPHRSTTICSLQRRPTLSNTIVSQTSDIQRIHGKHTSMPQPVHEPFSRRQKQSFACSPTRLSSIAQPSSPSTPDQWPSTAQERVEIAHHLPSSYLRRTMLHSHIVHSAPGGVTAHSSSSRCSCHIGTLQLVITNAR